MNKEVMYFGGGCFWGIEFYFKKEYGVIETNVGFIGGKTINPTYKDVCHGNTGHAEVVEVIYDTSKTNANNLIKLFFEIHDCTQIDRQGPDIGDQYRSEIFYTTNDQYKNCNEIIDILINKGFEVATILTKADIFYKAEDYHQEYFSKKGSNPTCHSKCKIF